MGKEFPKLLQLEHVEPVAYKSREGGAVRLRFERNRFSYIHMATEEIYNLWRERIGRYFWVQGTWTRPIVHRRGDEPVVYRKYDVLESA